jgi:NADH:ubiquinone oxidoreductase subunit 5 (subunit L)/multisubunit Na+/H+ antiporter MnhA subunit
VAALALAGGLTAVAFVKAFGIGFLGQPRSPEAAAATERAPVMLAGMAVLAVPCLVLGVAPGAIVPVLARAAGTALGGAAPGPLRAGTGLAIAGSADVIQPALLAAMLLAGLVLTAGLVRQRARARAGARRAEAWGCGREVQTARMQYTATSFAEPLQRVFDDVLRPDRDLDVSHLAESAYFEDSLRYHSRIDDAVERGGYRPLIGAITRWGQVARRAQNGSMHRYLAYGFAALVVMLVVLT